MSPAEACTGHWLCALQHGMGVRAERRSRGHSRGRTAGDTDESAVSRADGLEREGHDDEAVEHLPLVPLVLVLPVGREEVREKK